MDEHAEWNDHMFEKHPTPYYGLAGFVERARLNTIKRLADIKPVDTVLEIGCEAGNLLLALPDTSRLVGFDISDKALEAACRSLEMANKPAEFVQGNAEETLPFQEGEFSVIICSEMLEHTHNPRRVLEQINYIASSTTRVVLTVPYEKPKLVMKKMLTTTGLLRLILPGIENGLSEWHLQKYSKERLLADMEGLFTPMYVKTLLGLHVVARVQKLIVE